MGDPASKFSRNFESSVGDDAPTPMRGSPSVSMRARFTRATRGISLKHWKGARFVLLGLLLVLALLALFLAQKAQWFGWAGG